jgi:hypothetical protein
MFLPLLLGRRGLGRGGTFFPLPECNPKSLAIEPVLTPYTHFPPTALSRAERLAGIFDLHRLLGLDFPAVPKIAPVHL